ncbi:MAG: ATP-binding protein [Nitrospiraceae bacterium]|nr:ATP-binding protein [Nitrospiraceae bacterium]
MKQNVLLVIIAVFVVSLIITLNLFLQQNYLSQMAEQFNKQQLLLANTTSQNIGGCFGRLTDELTFLAGILGRKNLSGPGLDNTIKTSFNRMYRETQVDLVVYGRGILDGSRGKRLIWSSLPRPAVTPVDLELARRTMALDGKGPKTIYNDDNILKRGIIKLYMPVVSRGRAIGAIGLDISLDSINKKFLAPIHSGKKGYAWMMSDDGTLLYHPSQPGMIGRNLYRANKSCFACHKSFNTERWILRGGRTGASSYVAPFGEDKLIAFSKLSMFGRKWIVCCTIPYSEVTRSLRESLKLHSILILTMFGATFMGATMLIVMNMKRIKAEEKAKHEEELERYAALLEKTVGERTKELFAEKEKLNSIVNAVGGGLALVGLDDRIIWANKQFAEMAGVEPEGRPCHSFTPECPPISSQISDGIETNFYEGLFGRKGRYFQVTSAPVRSGEGIIGFIRLVQDITEMKKMEEQMLHSEKLSSVGRLTAGIAHEIGNPLTAVFSFLQILRDMEKEDFKKDSLETVLFHINRIAEIVRQLSSLSKVAPPELKKVNVNRILGQALDLMKYDKRAQQISFRDEFEETAEVVTDENQISQVFINLILNAVDAMPEGGTLTVRSKALVGRVAVEIEDTGIGISKEDMPRIFDPFFTTKEKGTGLGLSVSYGIMRSLGGELQVDSKPGGGSKFTVIIPAGRNLTDANKDTDSR